MQKASEVIAETRTCPICGFEFGINAFQKRKIYCDECKDEHRLAKAREYRRVPENRERIRGLQRTYYKPRPSRTYICKLCGKPFTTHNRGIPKYCMSCLEEAYEKGIHPYKEYYERRVIE